MLEWRLIFVGDQPAFVMRSKAKHLGNEWKLRFLSYAARSSADAQSLR